MADAPPVHDVQIVGSDPVLDTRWRVGEVAADALARVANAASQLARMAGGSPGPGIVTVHDAAALLVGFGVQRLDGKATERTNVSNPFVGRYRCIDGRWIYLHGGFGTLRDRLVEILGVSNDAAGVDLDAAVAKWDSAELEDTIASMGGCAAIIRSEDEWRTHPHGSVLNSLPLELTTINDSTSQVQWSPNASRPLRGLRVLDLTRVLAGPTCGRTLAGLGADVLHVRGPEVPNVPAFVMDTGHGKYQAHCDFSDASQRAQLIEVAADAHVVVQGYRPGIVERWGLDEANLRSNGFTGVYGSVSAYGPAGPWSNRAGWEQLAQSVSGLCEGVIGDRRPTMLPCAATDYTTGFVLAGAIVDAVAAQLGDGRERRVDAALCLTANEIVRRGTIDGADPSGVEPKLTSTATAWGRLEHLGVGFDVEGLEIGWERPPAPLGSGALEWPVSRAEP